MNTVRLCGPDSPLSWRRLLAAGLATLVLSGSAQAGKPAVPPGLAAAAAATAATDWNGVWVLAGSFMDKQDDTFVGTAGSAAAAGGSDEPVVSQPQLKGQYLARYQALQRARAAGKRLEDTGAQCIPQGMPRFWHGPYAFEILQTPLQINIYQEWNEQTRRIYLDGRKHDPDADPSYNGDSIGHWDGRTLVVDTAQVRADSGLGNGAMHSEQMHIEEWIRQIGPDLLQVKMKVTDPKALTQPWISLYRLRRKPGMSIEEYVCTENNRDTTSANGPTQPETAPR